MNRIDLWHLCPVFPVSGFRRHTLARLLVLLLLGCGAPLASAATCTWIGASPNAVWSSPGNWDACAAAQLVPADGDTVVFPVVAGNRSNVNDIVGLDLAQILIDGSSYVINGNSITLSGGITSTVALGGSSELDPIFGLGVTLVGTGQVVQCLGVRGLTLTGAFDLGGFGLGFDGVCEIRMQGSTSGGGGLTKTGTGTLILSAANTYSGTTSVNAGALVIRDSQALGANGTQSLPNGVATAPGGTLVLDASLVVIDEPLTLNGSGVASGGALQTVSGNSVWTGPVFLGSDTLVSTAPGTSVGVQNLVADATDLISASLTKIGAGTLELSGANTYRGTTTVADGILRVASNLALGATGAASGATILTGATIETPAGITVTGEFLTLNGTGVGGGGAMRALSGQTTWAGPVLLNSNASVAVENGATLTLSGNTSGSADLIKELTGTLILSGNNTYTGSTFINNGILAVQSTGALGGTGSGTTVSSGATLELQASLAIWNEKLILNGPGHNNTGALRNVTNNNTWAGQITLATNTSIGSDTAGATLTLSGTVDGSGGLTKIGGGTLELIGDNTYTGTTQVDVGVLRAGIRSATGATGAASGTTVAAGATLQVQGGIDVDEALTLNGIGLGGTGALRNLSGANTWSGPILLASSATIDSGAVGHQLTLAGNTSGSAGFTKVGTGTLILPSSNSYSGQTTIQQGVLAISSGGALGTAAGGTTVLDGAQLRVQESMALPEPLTLNGLGVGGTGAVHVTKSGNVYTVTFGGSLAFPSDASIETDAGGTLTLAGGSSGVGGLTKTGTGTLTLAGSNTYTGTTNVNSGVLLLTGSMNAVTVNAGATLEGNGSAGAITLNAGGVITPIGTLSASSLLWNGNGVIEVKLGGVGGGSDRLQLAGAMQKGSGTGRIFRLYGDVVGSAAPVPGVTYVLATYTGTTFVDADFSFIYGGPPGTALSGEFIVAQTQVEFVPTAVSLFRDGFENP